MRLAILLLGLALLVGGCSDQPYQRMTLDNQSQHSWSYDYARDSGFSPFGQQGFRNNNSTYYDNSRPCRYGD